MQNSLNLAFACMPVTLMPSAPLPPSLHRLLDEMAALGEPEHLVLRVLLALTGGGDFTLTRERSMVHRVR